MPLLREEPFDSTAGGWVATGDLGAIVGGGIGLLLTQAIITQKDWEDVAYYMILIVLMVMMMDTISGWIRRKFIGRVS